MAESNKNVCNNNIVKSTMQAPIIMKIHGPSEDSKEIEDNEMNDDSVKTREEFKMCSPSFRSSSTSTSNPFASSQNKFERGILKPPQLSLNNSVLSHNKTFILKPSQLHVNPFGTKSESSDTKTNSEKNENGDIKSIQVNGETPKFVPLIVPDNTAKFTPNQSSTTSNTTASNGSLFSVKILKTGLLRQSQKKKLHLF
ncbi:hypothetical protein NQ317_002227 [Molorchus minor]|uniref:Exophilin 5 n=1 Tax=Molorchus minor TaxID=1323400 RepID=A0ABQ9JEX4_9CUCU|nr:hypothetical protein NQ317_002227 [Molorchus minor]